jgi:hypothetical protein
MAVMRRYLPINSTTSQLVDKSSSGGLLLDSVGAISGVANLAKGILENNLEKTSSSSQ